VRDMQPPSRKADSAGGTIGAGCAGGGGPSCGTPRGFVDLLRVIKGTTAPAKAMGQMFH